MLAIASEINSMPHLAAESLFRTFRNTAFFLLNGNPYSDLQLLTLMLWHQPQCHWKNKVSPGSFRFCGESCSGRVLKGTYYKKVNFSMRLHIYLSVWCAYKPTYCDTRQPSQFFVGGIDQKT